MANITGGSCGLLAGVRAGAGYALLMLQEETETTSLGASMRGLSDVAGGNRGGLGAAGLASGWTLQHWGWGLGELGRRVQIINKFPVLASDRSRLRGCWGPWPWPLGPGPGPLSPGQALKGGPRGSWAHALGPLAPWALALGPLKCPFNGQVRSSIYIYIYIKKTHFPTKLP